MMKQVNQNAKTKAWSTQITFVALKTKIKVSMLISEKIINCDFWGFLAAKCAAQNIKATIGKLKYEIR